MAAPPNPSLSDFSQTTGGASTFHPESFRPVSAERPSRPGPWKFGQSAAVPWERNKIREARVEGSLIASQGAKKTLIGNAGFVRSIRRMSPISVDKFRF
jgi:hypothetical protein